MVVVEVGTDGLLGFAAAALPASVICEAVLVRIVAQVFTSLGCRWIRSTAFSQSPVSINQNNGGKSFRDERFADETPGSGVSDKVCRPIISSKIPFPSDFSVVEDVHMIQTQAIERGTGTGIYT